MRTALRETEEWARGHSGEMAVADLLKSQGWYVIPTYDYSGAENNKAPRLEGELKAYIVPDLDLSREGTRCWAEVKTKTAATTTYDPTKIPGLTFREARQQGIPGTLEHGIPERHVRNYEVVAQITGCPVLIVIYELSTGDVLWAPLDAWVNGRLSIMLKNGWAEGNMLYLERAAMKKLGTVA